MSEYTQSTSFAPKDATNDTVLGSEHDTELAAIETAISTKIDKVKNPTIGAMVTQDADGQINDSEVLAKQPGGLLDIQIFTSSGTWTRPDDSASRIEVLAVGPGGKAGGIDSGFTTTEIGAAGGSGAVAYASRSDEIPEEVTVTVGESGDSSSSFGTYVVAYGGSNGETGTKTITVLDGGEGGTNPSIDAAWTTIASFAGVRGDDGIVRAVYSGHALRQSRGGTVALGLGSPGPRGAAEHIGYAEQPASGTGYGYGANGAVSIGASTFPASINLPVSGGDGLVIVRTYK